MNREEVIAEETICGTKIKLVRINTDSYQLSEYNLEHLTDGDLTVQIPLRSNTGPKKYRQFSADELAMFSSMETVRDAEEEYVDSNKRCAICENRVDKKPNRSMVGVHAFIFHDTCFEKFSEIAGKSMEEFSMYLSAEQL